MSCQVGPNIVEDELIVHIDVSNDKCWSGSGTNIVDLSDQGNDMIMYGTMTASFPEGFTYPVNQITNYMIANPFTFPSTTVTVETWVKVQNFSDNCLTSYASVNNNELLLFLKTSTSMDNWIGASGGTVSMTDTFPTNEWFQFVYTSERVSGQDYIYLNGEQIFSGIKLAGTLFNTSGALCFGQEQDNVGGGFAASQCFEGQSPIFKLYNKVLTPQEIKQNFNALRGRFNI